MTNVEFETAIKEFLDNGGVVEQLDYYGPNGSDRTFVQKGYVASMGASRARLKDEGVRK